MTKAKQHKVALAFGAHPDDIEIGCGGTLIKLIQNGWDVHGIILTSGESGSLTVPREELAKIREDEAQKAADFLGMKVQFMRYPDGLTAFTRDMKVDIIKLIRSVRPDVIFLHHAEDNHPDHKTFYKLITDALRMAADPAYQEAGATTFQPQEIYTYEVWQPMQNVQIVSDISSIMAKKIEAIQCFDGQLENLPYHEEIEGLARYRGVSTLHGYTHAEVFGVLKTSGILNNLN